MAGVVFNACRTGCGGGMQAVKLTHHLHHFVIRYGQSILAMMRDAIVVVIAAGIGWALVPWVAPIIGRLCPFLIC